MSEATLQAIGFVILCMAPWLGVLAAWAKQKQEKKEAKMDSKKVSGEVALQMVSAMSKVADAVGELQEARKTLVVATREADGVDDTDCLIDMANYIARAHTALTDVLFHMPEISIPTGSISPIGLHEVLQKIETAKGNGPVLVPSSMIAPSPATLCERLRKHCATTKCNQKEEVAA